MCVTKGGDVVSAGSFTGSVSFGGATLESAVSWLPLPRC